jgi:hypothetical protein
MSEVVIIAAAAKVARRYPASWLNTSISRSRNIASPYRLPYWLRVMQFLRSV